MKKRIALLASLAMIGTSAVPLSASALYTQTSGITLYEGWSYCEDYSFIEMFGYDVVTVNSDGSNYHGYEKVADEIIVFKPADGVEIDDIRVAVTEINSKYTVNYRALQSDYGEYDYEIKTLGGMTISDMKLLMGSIKVQGLIKDAVYLGNRYKMEHLDIELGVYTYNYKTNDGTIVSHAKMVNEYLNENEISGIANVISAINSNPNASSELFIKFADGLSRDEKFEITEKIYKETGAFPDYSTLTSVGSNVKSEIKLIDYVDGDANDDAKLSLADAVSIMQAVGNPDEYGLTPQGEYNADIVGDYDGITNLDALTIQRKLLGLS